MTCKTGDPTPESAVSGRGWGLGHTGFRIQGALEGAGDLVSRFSVELYVH